ncbi:MAG: universal stress protein [Desulfobacterales bacterium]|jgi:nucleotide-binding universal stress UspA family protein|nr:universal stress protein [Desulfobacterales bacterium]MDD3951686.1 universal stress protein [Desulfobacterales bacterium]MDD4463514.1 universal stress protein [Desulfobacterales bacterium]MDY0377511.1 universal stress protein [Desulfobacterales bacterium]
MKRFKNILYVTEETVDQASAVARAVSLAENNQAELTILEVIPSVPNRLQAETSAMRMQVLESLIEPCRHRMKIRLDVRMGTVFLEIIRAVLRDGYDLVVKPAENPDFLKRLFGSDDMHLLRKCPCPVWFMKSPEKSNYNCILAAVDFDPLKSTAAEQTLNQNILELAGSLAITDQASLHLVHAWEPFAAGIMRARGDDMGDGIFAYVEKERMLHQKGFYGLGDTLRDRIGEDVYNRLSLRFHLPKGPAKKMISALAAELQADLVVMGTVARTGIPGFIIGNTAETILEQLSCSVLAVKPPGFATPVKLAE